MVDLRAELSLINKHIRQHGREAGESILWYEFLPLGEGSTYNDIYDEGAPGPTGRSYLPGIVIPTIYVEEIEDEFTAKEEGRQPTQNIKVTMLYQDVLRSGLKDPWEYQPRLNDMLVYDGRYYRVNNYIVRGRAPSDVLVVVQGYEVYVEQDMMWDNVPVVATPTNRFPSTFPVVP